MITPHPDEFLHQAFFGWSDRDRCQTLLVSSLSKEDEQRWLRLLERFVRLQTASDIPPPPRALSYFVFGDSAAVICRTYHGHSDGRTNAHVLIGPADLLDTTAALALDTWQGWQTSQPMVLEPIPASALATTSDKQAAEQLSPGIQRLEHELASTLSRLLDDAYTPLTIVDCPAEDRLPLLWGLREAGTEYLPPDQPWTFSTYEDRHDVEGLPQIVFVPVHRPSAAVVRRTVFNTSVPPNSQNAPLAAQLVTRFLHGTPMPAQKRLEEPHDSGSDRSYFDMPSKERQPLYGKRPETRQAPRHTGHIGHADGLLTADCVQTFEQELHRLETTWQLSQQRETLRKDLGAEALSTAARFVEVTAREELLTRLLEVAYGPGLVDLDDPRAAEHAIKVVRNCRSEQLAMMIGAPTGRRFPNKVQTAAFERWTTGGATVPTRPSGRVAQVNAAAWQAKHPPIVMAMAGVAMLLIVYLLGYLMG
ncbi:hypothetical protein [Amycolatopsis sp. CB00013]|uniref:hypothetical protein n=1 Tax=Amycolatopsis sp. CB00013 TaxID=1703945 RepID=UPI00093DCD39|nr:hypothetical protein [Amycolatopsis sp. CB00013]OKJ95662.1 hypothetical protein AMK34_21905 [Amycolatopsis sp. CB00013]